MKKTHQPQTAGALAKATASRLPAAISDERRAELTLWRERYGDWETFTRKFSVTLQPMVAKCPARCYLNDNPTLADIRDIYGPERMQVWVEDNIAFAAQCLGHPYTGYDPKSDTFNRTSIVMYANSLCLTYNYLKLSEWLLFFFRLGTGRYGTVFGDLTPDYITAALRQFLGERNREIDEYERQRKETHGGKRPGTVSREEFEAMEERGEI